MDGIPHKRSSPPWAAPPLELHASGRLRTIGLEHHPTVVLQLVPREMRVSNVRHHPQGKQSERVRCLTCQASCTCLEPHLISLPGQNRTIWGATYALWPNRACVWPFESRSVHAGSGPCWAFGASEKVLPNFRVPLRVFGHS